VEAFTATAGAASPSEPSALGLFVILTKAGDEITRKLSYRERRDEIEAEDAKIPKSRREIVAGTYVGSEHKPKNQHPNLPPDFSELITCFDCAPALQLANSLGSTAKNCDTKEPTFVLWNCEHRTSLYFNLQYYDLLCSVSTHALYYFTPRRTLS